MKYTPYLSSWALLLWIIASTIQVGVVTGCGDTNDCIDCICDLASPGQTKCGIKLSYYRSCKSGPTRLNRNTYRKCIKNKTCVRACVSNYLKKYSKKCVGTTNPAQISCYAYGRIHKGGGGKCKKAFAKRFAAKVSKCCSDKTTTTTTSAPPPSGSCDETCSATLQSQPTSFTRKVYSESDELLENPERGFMEYTISLASNPNPLSKAYLDFLRTEDGLTLVWRQWNLDLFQEEATISASFLDHIRADFDVIQSSGFSAVVRFMYTSELTAGAPYGDASKAILLGHIQQVASILTDYEHLITVVQAGFIGTWGEWYYTTHYGDPDNLDFSDPANVAGYTPAQWQDRHDILNQLLNLIPQNITIQIRYPQIKYHLLQDNSPTTQSDMQATNKKYRIGHHNDCFLSSSTDVGTYVDRAFEYPYLTQDNHYSTMGGETCSRDADGGDRS